MENIDLTAEKRDGMGTGASRRLRATGKVPAVMYKAGKDSIAITLEHNELEMQLKDDSFYTRILNIKLGDSTNKVVIKDMQRHAFKPKIMHLDFQMIDENQSIQMVIPIKFAGEDVAPGVTLQGGMFVHTETTLRIRCLPKDLPSEIVIDVSQLNIGEVLTMKDVKLPMGVEIQELLQGTNMNIVAIQEQSKAESMDEEGESDSEPAESNDSAE